MITYYYTYHFFTDHDFKQGIGDKWMGETSKCENSNQDGDVALNRASISDRFIPLQTTSELFTTLTEVFVPKWIIPKLDSQRMDFDPPTSSFLCIQMLKASGRRINTIAAGGNCLFYSLSKALLGTENFHYRIRTTLFGFIYVNSGFFASHRDISVIILHRNGY